MGKILDLSAYRAKRRVESDRAKVAKSIAFLLQVLSEPLVTDSPVGKGKLTGYSDAGYPQVNNITVAWCVLDTGQILGDPP